MSDVDSRIAASRAELEATLDAIEDKLNVPKRMGELSKNARTSYESNPMPWIIGGLSAAAVVIGVVAWAILSNDD
ncbi:hypothetical protein GCM10007382_24900 [Salinibacterium xinjiangense]|uniref:DUF3618 domain-containing protein n=1 Tax=Salinibacterium xinjiangense TaxID=386302 RepID=A0A2C9A111_9MICO|nr:DUF3618 domain-containing protein [Salinibacterium xinjiangense]GGL04059.1 hypothetical protein GCM10007382_24900 [Salinibacterium xinjiangense]SOE72637.1 Protein of unknown function [Salinibacterium xinjiangense]